MMGISSRRVDAPGSHTVKPSPAEIGGGGEKGRVGWWLGGNKGVWVGWRVASVLWSIAKQHAHTHGAARRTGVEILAEADGGRPAPAVAEHEEEAVEHQRRIGAGVHLL